MEKAQNSPEPENLTIRIILRIFFGFLFMLAFFYFSAGTLNWPEMWLYLFLQFGFSIFASIWLKKNSPELLKDRMIFMKKTARKWDKIIMLSTTPFFIALILIPGLDAKRHFWSYIPLSVKIISFAVIAGSLFLIFRVMRENAYLSRVVEIQPEREHKVITTGPYKYVRHPMYVAVIAMCFALPLALGSLYGIIPAVFLALGIIIRAHLEDKTLHQELPGYKEYAQKTKYRLLPGIW